MKKARARQVKSLATTTQPEAAEAVAAARPKTAAGSEAGRAFAIDSARLMLADRCEDILVLDLRGVSPVCDYFVIATGTSDRQMRSVGAHIEDTARQRGEKPFATAGYQEGRWIVLDYVDVVIHLFDGEYRAYYNLETLWGDCPKVEWAE
jgi:ribosome-associated protein